MKTFRCVTYDARGVESTHLVQANTEQDAINNLLARGLHVAKVSRPVLSLSFETFRRGLGLSVSERLDFTRALSTLVNNGLTIDEALSTVERATTSPTARLAVREISGAVRGGSSLSDALEVRWGFDDLYRNLVYVGEQSGTLAEVIQKLSEDLDFKRRLASDVGQAIVYPFVILSFCFASILFIFNFVIPSMASIFDTTDYLPWYTRLLLGSAEFVTTYQILIPVLLFFGVIYWLVNAEKVRRYVSASLARVPGLRSFSDDLERIRACSCFSLCLGAGIALEQAFEFAGRVVTKEQNQIQMRAARDKVRAGGSVTAALESTGLFDDLQTGLISVGEKAGSLESVFSELTLREREAFNRKVSASTAVLEPILIFVMAVITGTVVVIMMMSVVATQDVVL